MELSKNYYGILGVPNNADEKTIKKSYYKLSFTHHPDKGGDAILFSEMTKAYDVLCSDQRVDYDLKSKFGSNYDESFELFNINIDLEYDDVKSTREKFKRNEVNDIIVSVDDTFNGSVEFERFVKCKPCDGTGKDFSSKIIIRDNDGNILKMFDADDGCDFCDGTGQYMGKECSFCNGKGQIGITPCKTCKGEKRILGKQKLSGLKITSENTKIESMGHHAKNGNVGHLYLVNKNYSN
jgi:DnaJ-class molecular chaperone